MTEEDSEACEMWMEETVLSLAHRAYHPAEEKAFLDRLDRVDLADLRRLMFVCVHLEPSAYRSLLSAVFERRRAGVDTWPVNGHLAGHTLLGYLIAFRLYVSATELLSLGADPNGAVQRGRTPLYYALIQYDVASTDDERAAAMEMIQRLIRAGADPAAVARDGRMFGIRHRHPDLADLLRGP
jgi:ankyrin repeat protein